MPYSDWSWAASGSASGWSRRWWAPRLSRRSSAAWDFVTGSYAVVLRTMPASIAACGTVSFAAVVLK